MAEESKADLGKPIHHWPLWIPRALLLIYILGLFLYTVIDYTFIRELSPRFWDFGLSLYQMISMVILLLIAWFKPVIGGILILVASIVVFIFGFLILFTVEGGYVGAEFMGWGALLIIPGLLFLTFGRRSSNRKNE